MFKILQLLGVFLYYIIAGVILFTIAGMFGSNIFSFLKKLFNKPDDI